MAKRLGGQVGVEKEDAAVEQKYAQIADLNRRRGDRFLPPEKIADGDSRKSPRRSAPPPARRNASADQGVRAGYLDRMRMNFAAARVEHQLKSSLNAMASLFGRVPDRVNPAFLRGGDRVFFTPIENLVLAVRRQLARNAKNTPVHALRLPYFERILDVIKNWDIEGISRELTRFQKNPRNVLFPELREMCILLYKPMILLMDLDPLYHIAMAIKRVHDLNLLALSRGSPDAPTLKLQYQLARDMLLVVFRDIRARCYPMLMKLCSVRYAPYPAFLQDQKAMILDFLGLSPGDLLKPQDLSGLERQAQAEEPESAADGKAEEPGAAPIPDGIREGLDFLDALFPQAGFRNLEEYPDLYPYFQPLFGFPRGVELIPPEDPLQQVVVLVAILQELFYGFRAMRLKGFIDDEGRKVALDERIEALTGNWHQFLDEVVGKQYASNLDELCRQMERNRDFRATDYGNRLEFELVWTKRRFLLPHLKARIAKGIRAAYAVNLPKLPETVKEIRETVGILLGDIEKGRLRAIDDPEEDFSVAIEDYVSKRLRLVLGRRGSPRPYLKKPTSNASLAFHAALVLDVLDYLISSPDSFYYREESYPLFRSEMGRPGVPQYTVALEDPYTLIKNADERREGGEEEAPKRAAADGDTAGAPSAAEERKDRTTGFALLSSLTARLGVLSGSPQATERKPFTLVPLSLRRFGDLAKQYGPAFADSALKAASDIITSEIRLYVDLPYRVGTGSFILLLPETTAAEAAHLAKRLAERFLATDVGTGPVEVSVGIIQHREGWGAERLLKAVETTIREAGKHEAPAIVSLDPESGSYSLVT